MSETLRPARAVLPGEVIDAELHARGWTQRDLADIMHRPPQAISEIVRGSKQITPETALELAAAFDTSAEVWINLETNYRLHLARRDRGDNGNDIARRRHLYELLPVNDLIRRGWVRDGETIDQLESAVQAFAGGDPARIVPSVSFRHTAARTPEHAVQVAWVLRVQHLAAQQRVQPFDRAKLAEALPAIRAFANAVEQVAALPPLLNTLGIRFVIVPALPKTFIDGAVCDVETTPTIALTLRYDRIDSFWFTLMHELAHLVLGHTALHLDRMDDDIQQCEEQEVAANDQARGWLINHQALKTFVTRVKPYFAKEKVIRFATEQHVHPGIVVGQLMHDGAVKFNYQRSLLVKVSPFLAPWIDRVI
jgi:HTH-type transcriptional regulator/antitoxin HigA